MALGAWYCGTGPRRRFPVRIAPCDGGGGGMRGVEEEGSIGFMRWAIRDFHCPAREFRGFFDQGSIGARAAGRHAQEKAVSMVWTWAHGTAPSGAEATVVPPRE
jgi:hypothetical protein